MTERFWRVIQTALLVMSGLCILIASPLVQGQAQAATVHTAPVMGYNTWYQYGALVTEAEVLAQAKALVSSGLAAEGYDYVNVDDGWQNIKAGQRTANEALTANANFPGGIAALASQVHAMGLKLGIYTAIGGQTCADVGNDSHHMAASLGHYSQDAATFAGWGVDFVKVDSCGGLPAGTTTAALTADFQTFGTDIEGHGMVYSEELPVLLPVGSSSYLGAVKASAGMPAAISWRVAPDEHPQDSASTTILGHLADTLHLYGYARAGHWNDLDMLVPASPHSAHNFGWSLAQMESQMSVWAMEASPLLISSDLNNLPAGYLAALGNRDMIAIDQSGAQASVAPVSGHIEALAKGADGGKAVLLVNTGTGTGSGHFTNAQLHLPARATGRNVWTGRTVSFTGISITLPAGATELLVVN